MSARFCRFIRKRMLEPAIAGFFCEIIKTLAASAGNLKKLIAGKSALKRRVYKPLADAKRYFFRKGGVAA